MKAVVTGASSGIGRDFARELAAQGYDLIIVARREKRLEELKQELEKKYSVSVQTEGCDLADERACAALYTKLENEEVEVLINNAGFGLLGWFLENPLADELEMIDTNIRAVHILTKLFLRDFVKKDKGYILNVASSAAFFPGPLMSVYYATKGYVLRLTQAVHEELRRQNSKVYIGVLCPGPVNTEFGKRANVTFSIKGLQSGKVAKYGLKKMFRRKMVIVPGALMKCARFIGRFLPDCLILRAVFHLQHRKEKK